MTDDERMEIFRRKAAEVYASFGMCNTLTAVNMKITEAIGRALLEVLRVEDEQRGFV